MGILQQDEVTALIMKEPALDVPQQPESLKIINELLWPGIVGLQKIKIFDISKMQANVFPPFLPFRLFSPFLFQTPSRVQT